MPLLEYTGVLGLKRAVHLLRRATFGATKQQIDSFAALTPAQAVQQLFRQALPDPPLPLNPENGLEWVTNGTTVGEQSDMDLQECFKGWFIGQMLSVGVSPALSLAYSAREKIVFFFHTHFTAIQSKIDNSRALYYQNQLFRRFSLDDAITNPLINFKELTKKVSVDNAMLLLLDGYLNVKGSVNENYARELLELYTIGRGLEGTLPPTSAQGDYGVYTEQDVQVAAKLLSGWDFDEDFITLDPDTGLPRGIIKGGINSASAHDNSVKTFSARLGGGIVTPIVPGDTGTQASALDEISKLIDLVYIQPETAKNICRKIYRFFVFAPHDNATRDAIETAAIAEMASTFAANNFKILPVIENLLKSVHFYEAGNGIGDDNVGAIIKSPLDLALGTIRFFDVPIPDQLTAPKDFYATTDYIIQWLTTSNMGMNFYEPFDVSGYDAYAQYPVYHRSWISVNYLAKRYEFMRNLVNTAMDNPLKLDVLEYVKNNINSTTASNARNLVLELIKYLFPVTENLTFDTTADDNAFPAESGLTAERLNYFLKTFLDVIDADPEGMWTTRYTTQTGVDTIQAQLRFLFNALLQSPEYQLA